MEDTVESRPTGFRAWGANCSELSCQGIVANVLDRSMLNKMLGLCERLGEADLFSTFNLHNSLGAQVEGGRGHRLRSEARKRPEQ
jgi:hypothetical protein